jgi:anti-sigma factor RsiW
MAHDREVAGIRCGEVLEALPDYVEGSLAPERLEQVRAHLARCDWCERFGGGYAATVGALRRELGAAPPLTAGQQGRLRAVVVGRSSGGGGT